jgi:hypothetical protein
MRWPLKLLCVALTVLLALDAAAADARKKKPAAPQPAATQQPPASAPAATEVPVKVDPAMLRILIYTSIIALNQANLTGNYSVLRDLASPSFREANSPARLTDIFASIRRRNLDLSPILLLDPKLVRPPARMANGLLHVTGFFPSAPEQVNFDLAFQPVGGKWLLFGIALNTSPAATAQAQAAPVPAQAAASDHSATADNAKPNRLSFGAAASGAGNDAAPPAPVPAKAAR